MNVKQQSILVGIVYAIAALFGAASAPNNDISFKFGYGLGFAIWVPLLWIFGLVFVKLVRWLNKESA